MLHRWMVDNNNSNWAWGIHFVQHEKISDVTLALEQSPMSYFMDSKLELAYLVVI